MFLVLFIFRPYCLRYFAYHFKHCVLYYLRFCDRSDRNCYKDPEDSSEDDSEDDSDNNSDEDNDECDSNETCEFDSDELEDVESKTNCELF